MPFQVIYETFRIPPGPIQLVTAGPDQIELLCGYDFITPALAEADFVLSATIIGDPTDHIFEWEQILGETTGVTFITDPSLLTVIVRNTVIVPPTDPPTTGDADIKTFRFWVDRGSPVEQFDDMQICGDPCDSMDGQFVPPAAPGSTLRITFGRPRKRTRHGPEERHDQTVDGSAYRLIPLVPKVWISEGISKGEVPNYQIYWTPPVADGNNQPIRITVQENQGAGTPAGTPEKPGDGWVDVFVDNDPPGEGQTFSFNGVTAGFTYRLYVEFDDSPLNRKKIQQARGVTGDLLTIPKFALPEAIQGFATDAHVANFSDGAFDARIDDVIVLALKKIGPDFTPELADNFVGEGNCQFTGGRDDSQFSATIDNVIVRFLKSVTPDGGGLGAETIDAGLEDNFVGEGNCQFTGGRDDSQLLIPTYDVVERGSIWG